METLTLYKTPDEMKQLFLEDKAKQVAVEFQVGLKIEAEANAKHGGLPLEINMLLNENLRLSDYVDKQKISNLMFVYQIFDHVSDKKHCIVRKEEVFHSRKFKKLHSFPLLADYEAFLQADKPLALNMLANETLKAIIMLKKHKMFDYHKMYNDTKKVFEEKGLI